MKVKIERRPKSESVNDRIRVRSTMQLYLLSRSTELCSYVDVGRF